MSTIGRTMRVLAAVAPVVALLMAVTLLAALVTSVNFGEPDVPWWPGLALAGLFAVLVVPIVLYLQALKRSKAFYETEIGRGLSGVFDSDRVLDGTFDVDRDKLIVLSDLHKGTRDPADDFWRSERAYVAALGYYLEMGHRLVVLGDVEELWENKTARVTSDYRNVLELEAKYHAAGRYVRVWGNHDDDWRRERIARKYLYDPFGSEVARWEAVRLRVTRGEEELGTLFLAHGHQGTADSQILAKVARPTVLIFGMLQRRFNRPWNTPATDSNLRERHDVAMYEWARRRAAQRLVLIAGHTHRPVFLNTKPRQPSPEQVAELEKTLEREREAGAAPEVLGKMRAQAEYWRAQWLTGVKPPIDMEAPSYFNTGCCAFADGDVTGIEIADGQITLVRWPNNAGEPLPERLVTPEPLANVFDAVRAHGETADLA